MYSNTFVVFITQPHEEILSFPVSAKTREEAAQLGLASCRKDLKETGHELKKDTMAVAVSQEELEQTLKQLKIYELSLCDFLICNEQS